MVISNPCLFFLTQKNENFPGFFGRLSESFPELQTCVDKAWAPPRAVFTAPGESPGFQRSSCKRSICRPLFSKAAWKCAVCLFTRCLVFHSWLACSEHALKCNKLPSLWKSYWLDSFTYNLYSVNCLEVLGCWLFWFVQPFNRYLLCT